jgi:O-methyltransferase involved in polyketide biosynthesis
LEGVTYYLDAESILATLNFVTTCSPAGSRIWFDYMTEPRQSVYDGEPFQFFLEKENLESFLLERGLKVVEHLAPEGIER